MVKQYQPDKFFLLGFLLPFPYNQNIDCHV